MSTNIIFFGTPYFVIPVLSGLVNDKNFKVSAIITAPDEPQGRKKIITSPPLKLIGIDYGIRVLQPNTLKDTDFLELFKKLKPDLCIVAAYGKIIPKDYLDIPKYGLLNIHPSLLPKYRGPSPCQYAILNGDKETGVTIMKLDEEMDHGPIVANQKLNIKNQKWNSRKLCEESFKMGAELLVKTLLDYIEGKIKPVPQEHEKATYTKKLSFEQGKINWNQPAEKIDCFIRTYNPEPGAWTQLNGKILKIIETEKSDIESQEPNCIIFKDKNLYISAKDYLIKIESLQSEGGKIQTAQDFINGHKNLNGEKIK